MKKIEKKDISNTLECRIISMCNQNDIKKEELNTFTIRMDRNMQEMVAYLQEKKLLNKTSIIRLAVAELYNAEQSKESKK